MSKLYDENNLRASRINKARGRISYGLIEEHGINDDEWNWLFNDFNIRVYTAFRWETLPKEVKKAVYNYVDLPLKSREIEVRKALSKYRITTETPNYKEFDIEWI